MIIKCFSGIQICIQFRNSISSSNPSMACEQCPMRSIFYPMGEMINTGISALPSNGKIWFYVDGPSWSGAHWVGSASVSGLSAGSTDWHSFDWPIPSGASAGTYTYWAQAWTDSAISSWSSEQTFAVTCGSYSARVVQLYAVDNAQCGQTSTLWAQVQNSGSSALPSNGKVWFYVDGPSWSGAHWVGSASVADLSAGSTDWHSFDWPIPSGASAGTYTYWAQAWTDSAISSWSSEQTFAVTCGSYSARVVQLYAVDNAQCGQTSTLWAQVQNSGSSALPSNGKVWFYVDGPSWSGAHWVGSASVADLSAGSTDWHSFDWPIPSGASAGTYTYWAQAWTDSAISSWSSEQTFAVTCGSYSARVVQLYAVDNAQ